MTQAEAAAHDLLSYEYFARSFSHHYHRDMERRRAEWRIRMVRPLTRVIWLDPLD